MLTAFGADLGVLTEYDGGDSIALTANWNYGGTLGDQWQSFPLSTDLPLAESIRTKQAIFLATEREMRDRYREYPKVFQGGSRAWATIPLLARDRAIGAIGLAWKREREFSNESRHFMQTLAGYVTEAMERAALFNRVQETQEQLSLAIEASDIGIWDWIVDSNQLLWSARLQEIYGLKPGEFRNSYEHYQELLFPEDREECNRIVTQAIAGKRPYTVVHRVRWADGSVHWVQGRGRPYFDAEGRLIRMTGTSVNIDDKIEAEQRLQKAVTARDEFISVASHELKTPLTSLKLQVQFFQRRMRQGEDPARLLEDMSRLVEQSDRSVTRLTQLIEDMLDVSRIDSGKFAVRAEMTDVAALVRDVSERYRAQFAAAEMVLDVDAAAPAVTHADPYRLEQVLANLYTNAIRYARGSRVDVRVESGPDDVRVTIRDQGPGIPASEQERIFARFERGDRSDVSEGLGLGLFISRNIVEAHGGTLGLRSEPGRGACFTLDLPRIPAASNS